MNNKLAESIVSYMNELLECDRPAIAALIANRVPCNEQLADHPTCQVACQHKGYHVGILGVLNGLCGTDEDGWGAICAVLDQPDATGNTNGWGNLVRFEIRQTEAVGG